MNSYLFLTLKVFSATGGIEKVCRVVAKALYETGIEKNKSVSVMSMHDSEEAAAENKYFPSEIFRGYNAKRIKFIFEAVQKGRYAEVVILSHINLLVVGWMIKKISPATKVVLFAHGIEIWNSLPTRTQMMLACCDEITCVSRFSADKVREKHLPEQVKISVLNNCLDPFLPGPGIVLETAHFKDRYGFTASDRIIFTLSRLSAKERYKGYDMVIKSLVELIQIYPNLKYLMAGSYDKEEKEFIDNLIAKYELSSHIILTGFVAEEEIAEHFAISDLYVMPSTKEGFGIVFIEAMYYGLPVIAGNRDGSVDALANGKLGLLIDPLNMQEISEAIDKILSNREAYIPNRELLNHYFSFEKYREKLDEILLPTKNMPLD